MVTLKDCVYSNHTVTGCSQGGPQIGICNGVHSSGCPGNTKKYRMSSTPTGLNWGMGRMEQGHWELSCIASFAPNLKRGHLTYL